MSDDTIYRRAAIDAIFSEALYEPGMKKRDADAVVLAIFEKIKTLPSAQTEQQWIPVTERLPEEYKDVLVSVHFLGLDQKHKTGWNDHIKESWYVEVASHIDGNWTSYSDEYKVAKSRHIIVAWMPLPEPYEEEQK